FASTELVQRYSDAIQHQPLVNDVAKRPKYLERSLIVQKRARVVKLAPLQNPDRVKQVALLRFVTQTFGGVQRTDEILKRRSLVTLLVSSDARLPFQCFELAGRVSLIRPQRLDHLPSRQRRIRIESTSFIDVSDAGERSNLFFFII